MWLNLFCYSYILFLLFFVTCLLLIQNILLPLCHHTSKPTKEMAKKKAAPKAKEPVRIRRKKLANGNESIYLDIYTEGKRTYEFLKLYLIPETDYNARTQNQNTLQAARAIQAQRILDLTNGKAHIAKNSSRSEILLIDYLKTLDEGKGYSQYRALVLSLESFGAEGTTLAKVDSTFIRSFLNFLKNKYTSSRGQTLKPSTLHQYFVNLNAALNRAWREGIIERNPIDKLTNGEKPKGVESEREHLTPEEVERLKEAPCYYNGTREAFLFSCNCGLRISDIRTLKWGDIIDRNGGRAVKITMQKTKEPIIVKLSKTALEYLPERGDKADTDKVFNLPSQTTINRTLKQWAAAAQVNKVLTFHVARHTFATTLLTLNVNESTIQKLMGHKSIASTQVYAKIIDKKRDEAIDLLDGIL